MRLDFNVLWVEDQTDRVRAQIRSLERKIRKHGFRFCVQFALTVEEAVGLIGDDVYRDHIDLILMDYDFGDHTNGADGLVQIRRVLPYRDIVFYSANPVNLKKQVADRQISGVDCSDRRHLPDTVEAVFEKLVRKVVDIDHSRGIIMGATSDIDHCVNKILSALFDAFDDELKKKAIAEVHSKVDKKREQFKKSEAALLELTHFNEIGNHHGLYTANDRLLLMKKIMSYTELHKDKYGQIEQYRSNVMNKRNDLGHRETERGDGFQRIFRDRRGVLITAEMMRELRVELLGHQELFDGLVSQICLPPEPVSSE